MSAIPKSKHKEAITAHMRALKDQSFEVPEWETTVYYSPLTIRERDELESKDCSNLELLVHVIIKKARDADGAAMFTEADFGWLVRDAAFSVIQLVAGKISTADMVDVKSLGKPTPPETGA